MPLSRALYCNKNGSMYKLRKALEKDFKKICQLIKSKEELYRVYPDGKYPLTFEQVKEISKVRTELTVLTDNEQIIGFANFYNYKPKKSAFIGNIVIDEAYRGKGLGKKIVLYMLKIARDNYQLNKIKISVFSENTPALLLYTQLGFTPYAIEKRKDPKSNKVALIHMSMNL